MKDPSLYPLRINSKFAEMAEFEGCPNCPFIEGNQGKLLVIYRDGTTKSLDETEFFDITIDRIKCPDCHHEEKYSNPLTEEEWSELFTTLREKTGKYHDLVWYARIKDRVDDLEGDTKVKASAAIARIEAAYPEEVAKLDKENADDENFNPDWDHGFNSGMLAALRYFMDGIRHDLDTANEDFPQLDT